MNNIKNMWDFPVLEGVSFQNANRVHPLMQRRVQTIICELGKDQNIRKLILFGSSLEFRCCSNSDLDLYIEKHDLGKKLEHLPELDCETDIITNLPPSNKLYQEIVQTGLILFER